MECKWEELTLAAERLKNGMLSIRSEAEVHKDDVLEFVRSILSEKRKKEQKRKDLFQTTSTEKELPEPKCDSNGVITWNDALHYIHEYTGLRPTTDGPTVQVHVPLMQRGRGSTYEEKVEAILCDETQDGKRPSKRRREAYEQNIQVKKVSKEEDEAFYKRMSTQGGSGI